MGVAQKKHFSAKTAFFGPKSIFVTSSIFFVTIMARHQKGKVFVSGRPPRHIFGPKIFIFLRYTHITPIFWGQTDPTQWDLKSPIS